MTRNPTVAFLLRLLLASLLLAPLGTAWAQVKVTQATPASASQGTVALDVTIDGAGFDSGSKVTFLLSGTTNPAGVVVRKVLFKTSKQLVATIDVDESAVVGSFDIQVTTTTGRNGKGTTLFTVSRKAVAELDPCLTSSPTGGVVTEATFPHFSLHRQTAGFSNLPVWSTNLADASGKCVRDMGYSGNEIVNVRYTSGPEPGTGNLLVIGVGPGGMGGANVGITFDPSNGPATTKLPNPLPTLVNVPDLPLPTGLTPADGWYLYGMSDHYISPDGLQVMFNIGYTNAPPDSGMVTDFRQTIWTCSLDSATPSVDLSSCKLIYRPVNSPIYSPMAGWGGTFDTVYVTELGSYGPGQISLFRLKLAADGSVISKEEVFSDGRAMRKVNGMLVGGRELVAVLETNIGHSSCSRVVVVDPEQCLSNGGICPILNGQGQGNWARAFSWLPDGRIAAWSMSAPDRRGRCSSTSTVVSFPSVDPTGTPATTLTPGLYPDGVQ